MAHCPASTEEPSIPESDGTICDSGTATTTDQLAQDHGGMDLEVPTVGEQSKEEDSLVADRTTTSTDKGSTDVTRLQSSLQDSPDGNKCSSQGTDVQSSQGSSIYIDPDSSQIVEITKVLSQCVTESETEEAVVAQHGNSNKRRLEGGGEEGAVSKVCCVKEDVEEKLHGDDVLVPSTGDGQSSQPPVTSDSGDLSQGVISDDTTAHKLETDTDNAAEVSRDSIPGSDSNQLVESLAPSEDIQPVSSLETVNTTVSSDHIMCSTSSEETVAQEKPEDQISSETPPHQETEPAHPEHESMEATDGHLSYEDDFSKPPELVACYTSEKSPCGNNFMKGCKWSPDGTCLVTNSNDTTLRVFNLPQELYSRKATGLPDLKPVLWMPEGEEIYDYSWLPTMSSADPDTCCVASTSRGSPVHMWDAFTGKIRCSYRCYDHMDELQTAHSLCFSHDGCKLYCGFNKKISIFNINRPGRECVSRPTYAKHKGQTGIISCIAIHPSKPNLYVAGSYSREVAVYSEPKGNMVCMFKGQQGGVTHIMFSPDGNLLYSGGRKDPEILCWDLRKPGQIVFTVNRHVATNQRMYFDLDSTGRYLLSGNHDGTVRVWDTMDLSSTGTAEPEAQLTLTYPAHREATNGLSVHPSMPLLATSSGQRHFKIQRLIDDSDSEDEGSVDAPDNTLKIWWTGY